MKLTISTYSSYFKLSVSAVLLLFTLNLSINFFTVHSHILADGTSIIHSHINTNGTSNGSSDKHSHSAEEIESFYLAFFSKIGKLDNTLVTLILLLIFISIVTETVRNQQYSFTESPSLRGPPQYF